MTHCLRHGLDNCQVCRHAREQVEKRLIQEERLREQARKKYRTNKPYSHFGVSGDD